MADNRFLQRVTGHFAGRADQRCVRLVGQDGETDLSWGDIDRDSRRFLHAYLEAGEMSDAVVLIFLRHGRALYGSFIGAMLAGAAPSFMPCLSTHQNPELYWSSHRTLLAKIQPDLIVATAETFDEMASGGLDLGGIKLIDAGSMAGAALADYPDFPPEDAIALLQHSSGTTGLKKGVKLSYRAITEQLEAYGGSLAVRESDSVASWLPLYHDMGLIACFLMPLYFGLPSVQIDPFVWVARPEFLLREIETQKASYCWLPNFAFDHMARLVGRMQGTFNLGHMRGFINCSEPCRPQTFDRFLAAFSDSGVTPAMLQCCYAMAETVFAVAQTGGGAIPARLCVHADSLRPGRVPALAADGKGGIALIDTGIPLASVGIGIADKDGTAIDPSRVGEITIASPFLFTGYNRDPERTARQLRNGRYFTNDLGFMRDGRLYVLGRNDDLIIINGRNIFAHEIEAELLSIGGIRAGRSLAFAETDPALGTDHLIILCERDEERSCSDRDIMMAINERLYSIFEIRPRKVRLASPGSLIKTTSGKISREKNRELYYRKGYESAADQ